MAEARREIVTALKYHRAAMKQANEQQQQQTLAPLLTPTQPTPPHLEEQYKVLPLPNHWNSSLLPMAYPSPFSWPHPPISPLPISDNLNLPLPNQPLGLNLNFQGFKNIDTPLYNNNSKPGIHSSSSPLSSSSSYSYYSPSSPPPPTSTFEVPLILNEQPRASDDAVDTGNPALHPVMDDEEMAEIRTMGEQHDMEWNDTVNVVTSAWWCKFLKTMDANPDREERFGGGDQGDHGFHMFDDFMDIPTWLSDSSGGEGGESCLFPHHLNDYQN